ncbi:TPA: hypothetical protein HA265_00380 [Candidatus Woesearchaeota archaeon]|nr:hypothetical protein [Candidatus Woesearchaeota archaeon]
MRLDDLANAGSDMVGETYHTNAQVNGFSGCGNPHGVERYLAMANNRGGTYVQLSGRADDKVELAKVGILMRTSAETGAQLDMIVDVKSVEPTVLNVLAVALGNYVEGDGKEEVAVLKRRMKEAINPPF